jgi:hypothetical protein
MGGDLKKNLVHKIWKNWIVSFIYILIFIGLIFFLFIDIVTMLAKIIIYTIRPNGSNPQTWITAQHRLITFGYLEQSLKILFGTEETKQWEKKRFGELEES